MTQTDQQQQSGGAHPVLIVEDDEDIRETMIEVLESRGYSVRAASHGGEALAQLQNGGAPCIILLDLMMPVMDGWAFCLEKEKDPALAAIRWSSSRRCLDRIHAIPASGLSSTSPSR